jgi:hypothetical protein
MDKSKSSASVSIRILVKGIHNRKILGSVDEELTRVKSFKGRGREETEKRTAQFLREVSENSLRRLRDRNGATPRALRGTTRIPVVPKTLRLHEASGL